MSDMSFSIVPGCTFPSILGITPAFLQNLGIRFLMLDLDNTIAGYREYSLSDSVRRWFSELRENSIGLFIVSNSRSRSRVEYFANTLGIGFVFKARKPSPVALVDVMTQNGFSSHESAMVGDQVFTDTLAANRAGALSILVRPQKLWHPLHFIRYSFELPVRAIGNLRGKKSK